MKKFFSTHISAGLLTTGITCILFYKYSWFVFPIIGLTHGIAVRNVRLSILGFIASVVTCFLGIFLIPVYCVNYNGGPPPPWPDFDSHWLTYCGMLFAAFIGASFPLKRGKLILLTMTSSLISIVILIGLGLLLKFMFPPQICILEKWEYLTLLLSTPVIGLGMWGPVQMINRRTECVISDNEGGI